MIKDYDKYKKFEEDFISNEKSDYKRNFLIVDEMYKEAKSLGAFPSNAPLSDLESDIRFARVINSVSKPN